MKLPLLSAAFAAGVLLGARWEAAPAALALFALAAVLATALLATSRRSLLPGLLALAVVLGALRADAAVPAGADALTPYHGAGTLLVRGTVERASEPSGAFTRLRLHVDGVDDGEGWVSCRSDRAGHAARVAANRGDARQALLPVRRRAAAGGRAGSASAVRGLRLSRLPRAPGHPHRHAIPERRSAR